MMGLERVGAILERFLVGRLVIGVCRVCWCRQPLDEGARCLSCGGVVARIRVA